MKMIACLAAGLLCMGFAQDHPPEQVEQAWSAARAGSPTPHRLDAQHAWWLEARRLPGWMQAQVDQEWQTRWLGYAARDARLRNLSVPADALHKGCIDIGFSECRNPEGGYRPLGEGRLSWQLQSGRVGDDFTSAGYVLLIGDGESLRPAAWETNGSDYDSPYVFEIGGAVYVVVYGRANLEPDDTLYRFDPVGAGRLVEIDNHSWRTRDLPALLDGGSEGAGSLSTIFYGGHGGLAAATGYWRIGDVRAPKDAYALTFDIRDDRLVLVRVVREPR